MTRTSWKLGRWALLATTLLLALPAAARPGDCEKQCKKDAKACEDVCKKYAGSGVAKCTQACLDEEKTCTKECNPNAKLEK
ncbi:hypothetical protein [Vitiosangium sp. GDMCC 1.1324]|uniref:hypothetical protein n=1 Tax=Vitiosangium sp. (strain GDMCC 1.1324) TaxID=2138576 RepID=UPI000D3AE096|nr:hypothetical protein [Vitiosangium sp. GDMCC 1.1324]PTL85835.1 hypothetical protein DAT35_03835 [Vitiosangium sp. GDMCC 1.1324]